MIAWTHVIGWVLVHFVWQGAVVGLLVTVLLRLLLTAAPQTRYWVACAALATMIASPVITYLLLESSVTLPAIARVQLVSFDAADAVSSVVVDPPGTHDVSNRFRGQIDRLLPIVVSVWLVGVGFFLLRLATGWWHVRRLHEIALGRPMSYLQHVADVVAERLGLRRLVRIVDTDLIDTPTVVGWIRPVVLVPVAAFTQLSPSQIEAVLAHELSHIQRHDYVVNLIQNLAEVLLFYHPAVWWLSARIRSEREHCCDDVAVKVCGDALLYVNALKQLEEMRNHLAAQSSQSRLVFAATGGTLLGRVRRLLQVEGDKQRTSPSAVCAIAVVVALVTVGVGRDQLRAFSLTGSHITYQSNAEPAFQSVSIRTVPALTPQSPGLMCGFRDDGVFKAFGPASWMITCAYGIPASRTQLQLAGGPDWLNDELFEIDAQTLPGHIPESPSDQRSLMRALLADQFKLAVHRETMTLETLDLALARVDGAVGPHMRPTPQDCATWIATRGKKGGSVPRPSMPPGFRECGFGRVSRGLITNTAMTTERLANLLSPRLGKIVRDRTGLRGYFDLVLEYVPERIAAGSPVERGISLSAALQDQLGLKLEPSTSAVDLLVIDHVEYPSTR